MVAKQIPRLGDTDAAPGFLLLQLLSQNGWRIAVLPGFAGGILLTGCRDGKTVEMQGDSVAELAADFVERCTTAHRYPRGRA